MLNKGNKGCWICCVSSLLTFHRRMTINDQHSYIRFICKHPYAPRTVLLWTVTWFPSKSIPRHFPPRTWGPRVLLGAQGRREMQSVSSEKIAWTQQTLSFFGKLVKQHERTLIKDHQRHSRNRHWLLAPGLWRRNWSYFCGAHWQQEALDSSSFNDFDRFWRSKKHFLIAVLWLVLRCLEMC